MRARSILSDRSEKSYLVHRQHARRFAAPKVALPSCVSARNVPSLRSPCTLIRVIPISMHAHRVYLMYHTEEQVYVGIAAGFVMGVVWFFLGHFVLR